MISLRVTKEVETDIYNQFIETAIMCDSSNKSEPFKIMIIDDFVGGKSDGDLLNLEEY